ncbi:MAG: YceK/YidQ family lipoprotein [Bacteroidales bacterium]|nr:YceK/YidQ family lipoprotein [Bacteroidales bacterium]
MKTKSRHHYHVSSYGPGGWFCEYDGTSKKEAFEKYQRAEESCFRAEMSVDGKVKKSGSKMVLDIFFPILCTILSGCANIVLRTPLSSDPIKKVYFPTKEQAEFTAMCACPQSFFSPTGSYEFCIENVFTLPFAVVPAADLVVEAALDTVFFPADLYLACSRSNKSKESK